MRSVIEFLTNNRNKTWLHLLAIVAFCYISFALPLQIQGLPAGFDMLTDMRFAIAFQDAISAGHVFPSWANDNFGYGSVGIRFYPPLSLFLLAVTQLVTNDWFTAFVANSFGWMVVGCVGMYLFVKEWASPIQGLLAGILFAIVPQHLFEIFQSFMFGEFAAWGVLPFCLLFLTRICRGGTWLDTGLFAVSFSVLVLTHLPTTIIVSLCLPVYVLFLIDWSNFRQIFAQLLSAIALTLLATSFRWVILVNEVTWLAHNGPDHYIGSFYHFSLWLFPNVLSGASRLPSAIISWLFDITITLTAAFAMPALLYLCRGAEDLNRSARRILIACLGTASFTFFMLSQASFYVWDNIVFLQKLQFPWRWLSVFSTLCVVLFSLSVPGLMLKFRMNKRFVTYPAIAFVVIVMLYDFTQIIVPSAPIPRAQFGKVEEKIETEPQWKGWWPSWSKEAAFEDREDVVANGRKVDIAGWELESKAFTVQAGEAMNVRVKSFYYPIWQATVNGQAVELGKDENGVITVPVSDAVSRVQLNFVEPESNIVAFWISAFTWLSPLIVLAFVYVRKLISSLNRRPIFEKEFDYS
jgi:hypothetical protein